MKTCLFLLLAVLSLSPLKASEDLVEEPNAQSYHFTTSYQTAINAPASKVWEHAVDFGSWMVGFDMQHESGTPGQVGEVLRLYAGQDFFIQRVSAVPNISITIANLPSVFRGEQSTGIGVIHLSEQDGKAVVSVTMSRRYTWAGEGDNPLKATRLSPQFLEGTRNTWALFLEKLKSLSESS